MTERVTEWDYGSRLALHSNNDYQFGVFQQEGVIIEGEWIISVLENQNEGYTRIEFNINTKETKLKKKENWESNYNSVDLFIIQSKSLLDLSNEGMRWEGRCLNDTPFGYGILYNKYNEMIYQGVMIGNRKECFGTDFYQDLGLVEYCGCYWNNKRHGFGMSYDRKGELLYEGDYLLGSSEYEKIMRIDDDCIDMDSIHHLTEELIIGDKCFMDMQKDLVIENWNCLNCVKIGEQSFKNVHGLVLSSMMIDDC